MAKLLLIADAWAPQINGVARVAAAHVRELERTGWSVEVIEPGQFFNVRLMFTPDVYLALFASHRVARRIRAGGFDAVHILAEGPLGLAARRACLQQGVPFTTWYHTRYDIYVGAYVTKVLIAPFARYLSWFHGKSLRVMVSNKTLKAMLDSDGYANVVVVPLGVDTERFTRNPNTSVPKLPGPVFVYFGRMAPEKSPEEFLKLDLPGSKMVIGDGPLRKPLQKKYPKATFVGFKTGQGLVDYLSICDVFVFPSRTETFGLVQLEAMACGMPVAAHDVLGPRDVVTEGKDGHLSEDLAEAALKCLDLNRMDCRAKALQYSWANSAKEFANQLALIK
ncbi:MAG: glycosyltransferase family 1 protein [Patescibacteria group bacterium]